MRQNSVHTRCCEPTVNGDQTLSTENKSLSLEYSNGIQSFNLTSLFCLTYSTSLKVEDELLVFGVDANRLSAAIAMAYGCRKAAWAAIASLVPSGQNRRTQNSHHIESKEPRKQRKRYEQSHDVF